MNLVSSSARSRALAIMARCDTLACFSEEAGRITRRYGTPAMQQAYEAVSGWMRDAGMRVRCDNIGNLIGRYEGARRGAPALLLGSHLDTVRDAGKYDGVLGFLVALTCVERLHQERRRLPFALEVLSFADEEGLRFHTAYLGSTAIAGTFDRRLLERHDADGITLAEAVRSLDGDPDRLHEDAFKRQDVLGYVETHIEQGPVLERRNVPVGVVTSIMGQSRFSITFNGVAGHAGTVPAEARHDALCAAAELVVAVESRMRATKGLVATVGQMMVSPNASNVIPGRVALSLDVRHADDALRRAACRALSEACDEICERRGIAAAWQTVQEFGTTPCDPGLSGMLSTVVGGLGYPIQRLASGAGHDGVAMASLCPVAMLFVRCKDGVSHSPAEAVTVEDVAAAIDVIDGLVSQLADGYEGEVASANESV